MESLIEKKIIPKRWQEPKLLAVTCDQAGQVGDAVSPTRPIVACGHVGQWLLIVGPRSVRHIMMKTIAGIAQEENVNVLDGGGQFDAYSMSWLLQGKPEAIARINLRRAENCYQVLALLEGTPSLPVPFVVLELLNTFYDFVVKIEERKRLLQGCLEQLERLEQYAGGVVSVSPPKVPSKEKSMLFKMIEEAATDTYRMEVIIPSPDLRRLR
jgi:hypothetical protein